MLAGLNRGLSEHHTSVYTTEQFPPYCSLFISHLDGLWDSLPSAAAPFPYAWLNQARHTSDMWRVSEKGSRGRVYSSLSTSFTSLSEGNAFVDVIIGGMDEMTKMGINCCFEHRERERILSTGKQEGLVWEERSASAAGGRQGREFKKKCIIRMAEEAAYSTWKFTLNNLTWETQKKTFSFHHYHCEFVPTFRSWKQNIFIKN